MKKITPFVLADLLLAPLPALLAADSSKTDKPNILFIMTDQQTVSALSCAGNPYVKTPNLDRLAARGVRFTQSYASNPLCVPSRAGLFSSRMPHEIGVYGNTMDAELGNKGVPTMGELFQVAGYETAYAGKWHVHAPFPAYMPKAKVPGFTVLPQGGKDPKKADKKTEQPSSVTDPYAAEASVKFLQQPHSKPFLLVVSLLNPHDICYYSNGMFKEMLPSDSTQLPPLRPNLRDTDKLPSELKNELMRKGIRRLSDWTDFQWRQYLFIYYRLVESSDRLIGQVLDALDQTGLSSNTVVVFTSDHGEMMGSHQMRTKEKLYEESVSVPLIIAPPGAAPGVDQKHLVSGLDLMPTFLDYAGIAAPASLEGRSLRPLVEGKVVPWREFVVAETFEPEARMIRTGRYKYILFAQGENREQFFDLEKDPGELNNLVAESALADEVARHRTLLQAWMQSTGDILGKGTQELARIKAAEDEKKRTRMNKQGASGETIKKTSDDE
jgi:arylsulfatase A-like enzyme